MNQSKAVYKTPQKGQPLISVISSGCKTPVLEVKFCNLLKPFYYANSPTIPRYSVTCVINPLLHKDFLKTVQTIEKNEQVESVIKNETSKENDGSVLTGNVILKFQSKELIPVYVGDAPYQKSEGPQKLQLEDELARGEKVIVVYDILRYTKKNTMRTEHGITFKPTAIFYISKEES